MTKRSATAAWQGTIKEGGGSISLGSGLFEGAYSFGARFGSDSGTNPEELLGAAAAGCFTMALALALTERGNPPTTIETTAAVGIEKAGDGFAIPLVELFTSAEVPGIDEDTFRSVAEKAKTNCPVSKALAGTEIRLDARLAS